MLLIVACAIVMVASIAPLPMILARRGIRISPAVVVAALLPILALVVMTNDTPWHELTGLLAVAIVVGLLLWLWVREFAGMMAISDDAFPGRLDKPIWAAAMLLLPPVGAIAFAVFRRGYWPAAKPVIHETASGLA